MQPLLRGRRDRSRDGMAGSMYVQAASSDSASGDACAPLAPVLLALAAAGCGAFSFGYHLGVVNGPLEAIAAELGFAGSAPLQGLVVSSSLAGAALGSFGGAGLADSLGRRRALLLDCAPLLAGSLLCAAAGSLTTLLAGRVLVGIGIGLSSALVPLYISEIAPTRLRGALGSVNQLLICVGILAALLTNVALPAADWRTMFALGAAPAAGLGLGMLASPESPVWLGLSGQRAAAEDVATRLWGTQGVGQLGAGEAKAPRWTLSLHGWDHETPLARISRPAPLLPPLPLGDPLPQPSPMPPPSRRRRGARWPATAAPASGWASSCCSSWPASTASCTSPPPCLRAPALPRARWPALPSALSTCWARWRPRRSWTAPAASE